MYAKASALMETIERYSSLQDTYSGNIIHGTYWELAKSFRKVLHPDEVIEPIHQTFHEGRTILDYVAGLDLLNNEEVLVPAQLVFSRYVAKPPAGYAFQYSHTNGLASGNVLEEAICHALCEVIERDAVSIADLCASYLPYTILAHIIDSSDTPENLDCVREGLGELFVDDHAIFLDVDFSETVQSEPLNRLLKQFHDNGIPLLIKEITQKDIGVPTFVASSVDWLTNNYGFLAKGYGTHPDTKVAMIRAITEVSQTRAANIQGARDDLKKIEYKVGDEIHNRKWQFVPTKPAPIGRDFTTSIKFSEIRTYSNTDILQDIRIILNGLKRAGLKRAIIVELTNPNLRMPVVRTIVPGLETYEVARLFTNKAALMGDRAKSCFRRILSNSSYNGHS